MAEMKVFITRRYTDNGTSATLLITRGGEVTLEKFNVSEEELQAIQDLLGPEWRCERGYRGMTSWCRYFRE